MRSLIFRSHFDWGFVRRMVAWHVRFYVLRQGIPVSAGVYLTDACNCRCVMCHIWKESKGRKPAIYPRAAQERAIDALARAGCYYYSISGGEPTLVKDLPERLRYAVDRIPYVHVVTNGLTLSHTLVEQLRESGVHEISLSLDGTAPVHDQMRGVEGGFERTMTGLERLRQRAPAIRVVVNSVLTPYNLTAVQALRQELAAWPEVLFKLAPVTDHPYFRVDGPVGYGATSEPAPQADIDQFLDQAAADSNCVNSKAFLRKTKSYFRGERNLLSEQSRCLYPYHALEFDPQGNAYPCMTGMAGTIGLAPEGDLTAYLSSPAYRASQRQLERCTGCRDTMMLCYYEPRLSFPLHHLLQNR